MLEKKIISVFPRKVFNPPMRVYCVKELSLDEYFSSYLPKLTEDESYLIYLIARDREVKEKMGIKIDKILFRIKSKEPLKAVEILKAIRDGVEFEVKGIKLRREWIKIMHVLNPINVSKASKLTALKFFEQCEKKPDIEKVFHSALAKSIDFKIFMIDIDSKSREIIEGLNGIKARLVMTTKRGFHIHVWKEDLQNPSILFKLKGVEVKTRDAIEYVPSIDQGGFVPKAYLIDTVDEIVNLM